MGAQIDEGSLDTFRKKNRHVDDDVVLCGIVRPTPTVQPTQTAGKSRRQRPALWSDLSRVWL